VVVRGAGVARLTDGVEVALHLLRRLLAALLLHALLLRLDLLLLLLLLLRRARVDAVAHHPLGDHDGRHLLASRGARLADVLLERIELLRVELGDGRVGVGRLRARERLRRALLSARRHGGRSSRLGAAGGSGDEERRGVVVRLQAEGARQESARGQGEEVDAVGRVERCPPGARAMRAAICRPRRSICSLEQRAHAQESATRESSQRWTSAPTRALNSVPNGSRPGSAAPCSTLDDARGGSVPPALALVLLPGPRVLPRRRARDKGDERGERAHLVALASACTSTCAVGRLVGAVLVLAGVEPRGDEAGEAGSARTGRRRARRRRVASSGRGEWSRGQSRCAWRKVRGGAETERAARSEMRSSRLAPRSQPRAVPDAP